MAAVELRVPAESGSVALVRTAAASLCARLDFTLDRLDDVTLAVDEACALLIATAVPGAVLVIEMEPHEDGRLDIDLSTTTLSGRPPAAGTFAWTVLTALVDDVQTRADSQGRVLIALRVSRDAVVGS